MLYHVVSLDVVIDQQYGDLSDFHTQQFWYTASSADHRVPLGPRPVQLLHKTLLRAILVELLDLFVHRMRSGVCIRSPYEGFCR